MTTGNHIADGSTTPFDDWSTTSVQVRLFEKGLTYTVVYEYKIGKEKDKEIKEILLDGNDIFPELEHIGVLESFYELI